MAKKIDPKAKAKKQKIYAAIGGVILLGVLAFQVPRTMKMLHPEDASSSSSSTSAPAATSPATTPTAAPSLAGGNAVAAAPTGGDGLVDADVVPTPQSGQLLAFGLFRSKDPFRQQLELGATGSSGPVATRAKGATGTKGAKPSGGGAVVSVASGEASTPKPPSTPAAAPTTAQISVNGAPESITVGGTFPAADPFFKLLSLTAKRAKITISGGSFANGAPSVTLQKGKSLTLMNTSDGTRYVLRLLSVS